MKEPIALPLQRYPKQTLYHAWAPKLGRTILFTGRDQLRLWAMLEAHPGVSRYCERPTWPDGADQGPVADFWALRDGKPVWLEVQEDPSPERVADPPVSPSLVVDTITLEELDKHRIWIQNWLSLLPYLSTASVLSLGELQTSVIEFVGRGSCIGDVESHFSSVDSVLVRTAVVAALHQGRLVSADLQSLPWDMSTRISKVARRGHDEAQ